MLMDADRKNALTFLKNHKLGVLSTVTEGDPSGAVIYYVVNDDLTVYFLTHVESNKYQHLKTYPTAALTIFDEALQATVQMTGEVHEATDDDEQNVAFQRLAIIHPPSTASWAPPISKMKDDSLIAVMKLTPDFMQYADYIGSARSGGKAPVQII
jgi:uncharacterized pyridoxamine 5'-phosphate oxidase family protein